MPSRLAAAIVFIAALALAGRAGAQQVTSAYSEIADATCTTYAAPGAGEEGGDWANLVCDGHRGYPVFIFYADARESVFYGFPPAGDLAPSWESFSAFNSTGPRIEWRIETVDGRAIPFATIHRWFVSDPEDADAKTEVLVVAKVGQPSAREGCAVGYVVATGNPGANEKARLVADGQVRDFVCGADQPTILEGSVPVPEFTREAN